MRVQDFIDRRKCIFFLFFIIIFSNFSFIIFAQQLSEELNWEKLYNNRLYSATIFQIRKINDISPDLKNYILGTCYYYLGNYDIAEFYLRKVSSILFRFKHDPVAYYLGIISFFKKDYLIAVTYFNEISSIYDELEECPKYLYYFSLSLIEIGKTDLALRFLKIGLDSNFETYKQYYSFTIAKIYYNLQDFTKAAAEFEKFLFLYSDSSLVDDTLYYLGRSYYNLKDYKNAKTAFASIVNLYRTSEYYYSSLYYLGQITGNKIYFEEIISKNPSFNLIDYVYYYLAKQYFDDSNYEKAYDYFNEAFNKSVDQVLKYNCIVYILKIKGDIPLSYIEKLTYAQRKPILEFLLSNYFYFKQYKKIFDFEKGPFSEEILKNPYTLVVLGKTYLEVNDFQKSLSLFLEALKYNPADYKIYFFIAYNYYKLNDYENAQKLFSRVIVENNIETYYAYYSYLYLGILELKNSNYKNSAQYFEQILLKYPTYKTIGEVYYFLSIVYYNLRDYKKSLSAIEFAYASSTLGNLKLAIIYQYIIVSMRFDTNKTSKLFEEYENISDDALQNYNLATKVAEYFFSTTRYQLSKDYFEKALKYCKDDYQKIDTLLQIIAIYYNLKEYKMAYEKLSELLNIDLDYRKNDILFFYFNTAINLKDLSASELLFSIKNDSIKNYSNFIMQFLSLYREKQEYKNAIQFIDKVISKYTNIDVNIKYELLMNKAKFLEEDNDIEKSFSQYLEIYQNFEDKRKDIEFYLIDIAVKLKKIDFLKQKIPILYAYNDENLELQTYYLLLKLFFTNQIDKDYINDLKDKKLIKLEDPKYNMFFIYLDNRMNIKKQTELFRPFLSSKNTDIAYWSRFFYSVALLESKDYKNSKILLESLLAISNDFQKELIYYFLSIIENQEGKEKKYWEILIKEYPYSLFI